MAQLYGLVRDYFVSWSLTRSISTYPHFQFSKPPLRRTSTVVTPRVIIFSSDYAEGSRSENDRLLRNTPGSFHATLRK